MNKGRLSGKIALVTGASRGIGRAIAVEFAREGAYAVVINYLRNDEAAFEVKKMVESYRVKALLVKADVSDRSSVRKMVKRTLEVFGKIDILVNNAALLQQKEFEKITDEEWDSVLNVNLKGPFMLIQEVVPQMVKNKWGRIINIASIGGQWGGNLAVHYAASKAALISLTLSIARIYSKYGITSNAVSPGLVITDMSRKEIESEIGKKKLSMIPIGRFAQPEEIAKVVAFLASDDAAYITGQTINVNGGMLFSHGV